MTSDVYRGRKTTQQQQLLILMVGQGPTVLAVGAV